MGCPRRRSSRPPRARGLRRGVKPGLLAPPPPTKESRLDPIDAAARLLAGARRAGPLPGLPQELRPRDLAQAEAIQHATLAALGEEIGGWKVGRQGGQPFSAPFPASATVEDRGGLSVALPAGSLIELEIALRFPAALDPAGVAALRAEDLPRVAQIATLFEFVQPRFAEGADPAPLDRVAECLGNNGGAVRAGATSWSLAMLDAPPVTRLSQDGAVLARHEGPHVAAPVLPLIEAWIARLAREGRGIAAGEVLTFGSLTGMRPVPAGGAAYLGEIEGLEALRCAIALPDTRKP